MKKSTKKNILSYSGIFFQVIAFFSIIGGYIYGVFINYGDFIAARDFVLNGPFTLIAVASISLGSILILLGGRK